MKRLDHTLSGHLRGDHLGARMAAARKNARITRADAAKRIGISAGQLGRIERGGVQMVSSAFTLVLAGRIYGVSDVWLYAGAAGGSKFIPAWYEMPAAQEAA